jgi:hypothetical protein
MRTGESIDLAVRMFQVLGWSLLRLSAAPALFCMAGIAFLSTFVLPNLGTTTQSNWIGQVGELVETIGIGLLIGGPLYLIGAGAISVVATQLVSDYMLGNVPDEKTAQRTLGLTLGRIIKLSFRETLLCTSGLLVATLLLVISAALHQFVPGSDFVTGLVAASAILGFVIGTFMFVYMRSIHSMAPAALVLEGLSARDAARRSNELGKGSRGSFLSVLFAMGLVVFVFLIGFFGIDGLLGLDGFVRQLADQLPLSFLWMTLYQMAPFYCILWIGLPFWSSAVTLIYYDRRIAKEGFDIDALAGDIWRADQIGRFQL